MFFVHPAAPLLQKNTSLSVPEPWGRTHWGQVCGVLLSLKVQKVVSMLFRPRSGGGAARRSLSCLVRGAMYLEKFFGFCPFPSIHHVAIYPRIEKHGYGEISFFSVISPKSSDDQNPCPCCDRPNHTSV